MRVAIIKSEGYIDSRIERILRNSDINGEITTSFRSNMLNSYDVVIFSHRNNIPNIAKVVEQIVMEKKVYVIYVLNTLSTGEFYNVLQDEYFGLVKDQTMEIELPLLLQTIPKYLREIALLRHEVMKSNNEILYLKQSSKAKRVLMEKGLTEEQSHRFIIQKAMDLRKSKSEIVNLIIQNKVDI